MLSPRHEQHSVHSKDVGNRKVRGFYFRKDIVGEFLKVGVDPFKFRLPH